MRDTVPKNTDIGLNLGTCVLEKDVEVVWGRLGGRQGCNIIVSLLAHVPSSVVLGNAKAGQGIGSPGGKTTWKQDFVGVGGFCLDSMESLPL